MDRTVRSRTRLDRETRREQIVEAAVVVLHGRDPADVTFEEIAEAAGVSRALVYNYFGDRHGLIAAVYLRNVRHLQAEMGRVLDGTETMHDAVAKIVRAYLVYARSHHLAATETMGAALTHPASSPLPELRVGQEESLRLVADRLGGGAEAELVARGVIALVEAAVLGWVEQPQMELDRAAELIVALAWSGLAGLEQLGWHLPSQWGDAGVPAPAPAPAPAGS
ncbi:MAG: TetR family transcriptional regulator [Acidimicrobiales bacterium]|nr:TetR family transcriptional regulator [Acidimicrobiales bacterium]